MKPLLIFPISDPHTGSTVGLHPNYIKQGNKWITVDEAGGWPYVHNPHYYLNSKQVKLWKHHEKAVTAAAELRKEADLLIVVMGDAIDGDHHHTNQLTSRSEVEQMRAHVALMQWTKERLNFGGNDKLIYIEGTESHTRDNEEFLAADLGAVKFSGGRACVPFLEMTIFGKLFWFFHHGVQAGYSFNSGNGSLNFLRQIYFDRMAQQKPAPHFVITGHTHKYDYQTYRLHGHEISGLILPPMQEKTRFTNRIARAIVHPSKVGYAPLMAWPNGYIEVLPPYLLEMPLGEKLEW